MCRKFHYWGIALLGVSIQAAAWGGEWTSLFNGKNLDGWSGDRKLWSVDGGELVGRTDDAERKITENSYLLLDADVPGDFELEFEARVSGENSGVQYRSRRADGAEWGVAGYQCDLHPAPDYLGMLYEERGAGILCTRGKKLRVGKGTEALPGERKDIRLDAWNRYRITAFGRRVRHEVNGEVTAEVWDEETSRRPLDGILALQLHVGAPMTARFRNIRIRAIEAWPEPDGAAMREVPGHPGFRLRDGFHFEKVHQVAPGQGSWVAMTKDDEGNLYCADQYGGVWKVRVGEDGTAEVSDTGIPVRGIHGMQWWNGALWISSTEGEESNGLWKVAMENGAAAEPVLLKSLPGGGEHGIHGLRVSPDGGSLYLISGNFVDPPDFAASLVPRVWGEDQLLPRRPDANGHASGRMAPGGWIARIGPDGRDWTLVAIGLRNPYALAFHRNGDLFTYDADMEWDLGMPWYRPTRICHVVPGADFGWRHGTGKWPESYEDSVPPVLNLGPGSPTGLVSGDGAAFPARYQGALFAFDWTYATIRAIHLEKSGAGYRAESEEFFTGGGMPLTDGVVGRDGALYFLTGGRRVASALWRIRYTGGEDVAPLEYRSAEAAKEPSVDEAWDGLGSDDRIRRYLSRTALELAGPEAWRGRIAGEENPWRVIGGATALARTAGAEDVAAACDALSRIGFSQLDAHARINWLRAFGIAFARHGAPADDLRTRLVEELLPVFPTGGRFVDRELCRMLCYLRAPGIVGKTLDWADGIDAEPPPGWLEMARRNPGYGADVENMIANFPSADRIHAIYCLRVVPGPWSADERKRFFAWSDELLGKRGGQSYAGFLKDLREEALRVSTPAEQEAHAAALRDAGAAVFANLPPVEGPGRAWTVEEIVSLAADGLSGRDPEAGRRMFQAALCSACHRHQGEGGASGPDLTAVAGRFSLRDLAEAVVDPGKAVSDQYAWEVFETGNGASVTGRLIEEREGLYSIAGNPFDPSVKTYLPVDKVTGRTISPASPMPPGLINRLNAEELKDLLALLLAKGGG